MEENKFVTLDGDTVCNECGHEGFHTEECWVPEYMESAE